MCRKAQREREKAEELRISTDERNVRNAELQRRIELRKLAKLKKKKQEEVKQTNKQNNNKKVRGSAKFPLKRWTRLLFNLLSWLFAS